MKTERRDERLSFAGIFRAISSLNAYAQPVIDMVPWNYLPVFCERGKWSHCYSVSLSLTPPAGFYSHQADNDTSRAGSEMMQ